LGVGKGKLVLLFISILYLVLYFVTLSWNPIIGIGPININFLNPPLTIQRIVINLQGQLIVVGIFLTYLLVQHLVSTDHIISQIIEATRKKYLHNIDQQIAKVNTHMQKFNDTFTEKSEDACIKELHKNAKTMNELLQLRQLIEQSRDRPRFRRLQLLSPIMTSLILPTILEGIIYPLVG
jgi:hypothetical protein